MAQARARRRPNRIGSAACGRGDSGAGSVPAPLQSQEFEATHSAGHNGGPVPITVEASPPRPGVPRTSKATGDVSCRGSARNRGRYSKSRPFISMAPSSRAHSSK